MTTEQRLEAEIERLRNGLIEAQNEAEANCKDAETLRRIKGGAYIIAGNDLLEKASLTAAKGGDETDS